jgi:hypothetical protein
MVLAFAVLAVCLVVGAMASAASAASSSELPVAMHAGAAKHAPTDPLQKPPGWEKGWNRAADQRGVAADVSAFCTGSLLAAAALSVVPPAAVSYAVAVAIACAASYVLFKVGQQNAKEVAQDPPDPNFTIIATPQEVDLPSVAGSAGLPGPMRGAVNAYSHAVERDVAIGSAMLTSYERYQGAVAAGDQYWSVLQACATGQYAKRETPVLQGLQEGRAEIADALPKQVSRLTLSVGLMKKAQKLTDKKRKKVTAALVKGGLDEDEAKDIVEQMLGLAPRAVGPIKVANAFTAPGLASAEGGAAQALEQFAKDALDFCPHLKGTITYTEQHDDNTSSIGSGEHHSTKSVSFQASLAFDPTTLEWSDDGSSGTLTGSSSGFDNTTTCHFDSTGTYSGNAPPFEFVDFAVLPLSPEEAQLAFGWTGTDAVDSNSSGPPACGPGSDHADSPTAVGAICSHGKLERDSTGKLTVTFDDTESTATDTTTCSGTLTQD